MPRDGSGTYTLPAGSAAVSGTTISSTKFNALINDLESDANTARPISAGGTGAGSATAARTALGVPSLTGSDTISGDWTVSGNWTISGNPVFSGSPDFSGVGNASTIRTDLGLAIGTDVQAYDAALASLAGLSLSSGDILYSTAADTLARLAAGTNGQFLSLDSGVPAWADAPGITHHADNPKTATGTTLNFGSIPSGVNRVIVAFENVSASGGDVGLIRFGDSGGVETTGYSGIHFSTSFNATSPTDGFIIQLSGASRTNTGQWEFTRMNGNKWVGTSVQTVVNDVAVATAASKTLSGELTQVEIVLTGSNNFDAGTFSVLYQ